MKVELMKPRFCHVRILVHQWDNTQKYFLIFRYYARFADKWIGKVDLFLSTHTNACLKTNTGSVWSNVLFLYLLG